MRVFFFVLALLFSAAASAQAVPKVTEYAPAIISPLAWSATGQAACSAGLIYRQRSNDEVYQYVAGSPFFSPPASCNVDRTDFRGLINKGLGSFALVTRSVCPSGTKEVNGQCQPDQQCVAPLVKDAAGNCSCPAGTKEETDANGLRQCKVKKSDACGDLEGHSLGLSQMEISVGVASTGALVGMVGKPGTSCFPGGCTVSGMVNGCISGGAGGAVCFISSPSFTGAACEEKEPDKGCPPGTTPSAYAAGVCIPDKNDCPSGYSPSKYAAGVCIPDENPCPPGQSPSKYAQGVCLPNEDPNANGDKGEGKKNDCPKGYVPSKYVAGLCIPATTTTDKDGTTTCIGAVCTTTKPDGSKEEKPKDQFCAENPDSPLCVKGEFAGTCSAGFTCKGDAIQCAMAKEQHQQNCKLFGEDKDPNSLTNKALNGTDGQSADKLRENATQVSVGAFDSSGYGWSHACPADPSIALNFGGRSSEFSIPFSRICGPLSILSLAGVGITLLGCLVWVLGGKNNRG